MVTSLNEQMNQAEHNLTNHAPVDDEIINYFESIREDAKTFARTIVEFCPNSREKSLALTNLEQAVMWAVASIARNQEEALKE